MIDASQVGVAELIPITQKTQKCVFDAVTPFEVVFEGKIATFVQNLPKGSLWEKVDFNLPKTP